MGAEKHGSKGGGGWLQLFDWNAKSRKKLFSSKSSPPELSKQKKRCDGNTSVTLLHLVAEDDILMGSRMKGSSDCSCASSVIDEELGVSGAPGVVARLMGLDSMTTTSTVREAPCTLHFDTHSLQDSNLHSGYQGSYPLVHLRKLKCKMDASNRDALEPKHPWTSNRAMEKFQAETLPPKSAKSIPITQHKLLSPIKSANSIPSENAAHIMEVAAKIIGPGPRVTAKPKLHVVGASSVPLKVRDLKEKVQAAQKSSKLAEASCRSDEYDAFKHIKGPYWDKKCNGLADAMPLWGASNSEESLVSRPITTKAKSRSISLALQAKANVQKREGLYSSGSRSQVELKEQNEDLSSELFKRQPNIHKSSNKKPSLIGSSNVLQQNNQKQNCLADRLRIQSKQTIQDSKSWKPTNGDSSAAQHKRSSKSDGNAKVVLRRSRPEVMDCDSEGSYSSMTTTSRKKRSIDGHIHVKNPANADDTLVNKSEKLIQPSVSTEKETSFCEAGKRNGTDVVSFTFTAPLTRSTHGNEKHRELQKEFSFGADFHGKEPSHCRDDINSSKFTALQCNLIGNDDLNNLLDRTLREINHGLDTSLNKPGKGNNRPSSFQAWMPILDASPTKNSLQDCKAEESRQTDEIDSYLSSAFSSTDLHRLVMKHKVQALDREINKYWTNDIEAKDVLEYPLPSPLSILENSFSLESCNSSDTADSFRTGVSKPISSIQAQVVLGVSPFEADAELSDSASSISVQAFKAKQVFTTSSSDPPVSSQWELDYVKEILSDIDVMLMDFILGRTQKIIDPHKFNELKNPNRLVGKNVPSPRHKLLFDCVVQCIDNRCRRHISGGRKGWMEGLHLVKRKEKLAEDIYKEVSGWSTMGDCMVDELVDKDMSNKYGRWLDFEIEASELGMQIENRILNMLLDEVIADILQLHGRLYG